MEGVPIMAIRRMERNGFVPSEGPCTKGYYRQTLRRDGSHSERGLFEVPTVRQTCKQSPHI